MLPDSSTAQTVVSSINVPATPIKKVPIRIAVTSLAFADVVIEVALRNAIRKAQAVSLAASTQDTQLLEDENSRSIVKLSLEATVKAKVDNSRFNVTERTPRSRPRKARSTPGSL